MKTLLIQIAVLFTLAGMTVVSGACPELKLKENFDVEKYMGMWFEIQSQPSIFQPIKSCLASSYKLLGSEVHVSSKGFDSSGKPAKTTAKLTAEDPNNKGHLVTDFVPGVSPPYDVVDTDYNSYSCIHSCVSIMTMKTEFVFIYSRNRTLDPALIERCRKIFESYGIGTTELVDVPQTNCHSHSDL